MKKWAVILAAVTCLAPHLAFGIAASQAWVSNFVMKAVASSASELRATSVSSNLNGVATLYIAGDSPVRVEIEDCTVKALRAGNCTAQAEAGGITNGALFVWNGAGAYVNPLGVVSCTSTNLVFSGVGSVATNGVERFAGWFDARGVLIQPVAALAATNGMAEVAR